MNYISWLRTRRGSSIIQRVRKTPVGEMCFLSCYWPTCRRPSDSSQPSPSHWRGGNMPQGWSRFLKMANNELLLATTRLHRKPHSVSFKGGAWTVCIFLLGVVLFDSQIPTTHSRNMTNQIILRNSSDNVGVSPWLQVTWIQADNSVCAPSELHYKSTGRIEYQ